MDKRVLGKYQLIEKIGSGGMGEVYRSEVSGRPHPVAVKVLHWDMASEEGVVSRFRNEAKTIRQLAHPNIVKFLDGPLEQDGLWYFVMEFAEGEGLDEILKRRGKLPLDQIVRITTQACAGMQHAHEMDVIHRDLKPSNIKIGINDFVKVMDFGIAKVMHSSVLTSMHTLKGTVEYMSPEQCREGVGEEKESDIYSLGVILYQMTTGEVPFSSKYWYNVLRQHLEEEPSNPRQLNPHIPEELDACIMKCLQKDPSQRFRSMAELSEAVRESVSSIRADDAALGCNQVIGERYRLDVRLSHKGQCAVYRGVDLATGETVAVKLLPWYLSDNAEYRERLTREAHTLEQLAHNHVVSFRAKLITDDNIYVVIEWVEGVTLSELIETRAPLPPIQARHILRQVCAALTYLHNSNIVHRDIKGSNIMVGGNDRVTLLDFGIVRLPDSTVTAMGQMIGTPKYMSPEQCRGERVDVRSDVYSLGLLVFEMLTGEFPYKVSGIEGYLEAHCKKEPLRCTKVRRDLPRALEKWFSRVLAKTREKRFASVLEMLEAFDKACHFGQYRTPSDMLQNTICDRYQITQLTSDTTRWSFRARDLKTSSDVIIKGVAFVGDYSEDTITTLHDSAVKLVRKLPRGCPQTDDILEENGRLFVVRSFMDGSTSREVVRQRGRLSLEDAVRMVTPLCMAVKEAHQSGVYGFDLHPSHALFPPNAPEEEPVLIGLETACIKHDLSRLCSDKGLQEVQFLESRQIDTAVSSAKAKRTDTRSLWLLFDEMVGGKNFPDAVYSNVDAVVSTPPPPDVPEEARLLWTKTLKRGKKPEFAGPDELLWFLNALVASVQTVEIELEPAVADTEGDLVGYGAEGDTVIIPSPEEETAGIGTAVIRPAETAAPRPGPVVVPPSETAAEETKAMVRAGAAEERADVRRPRKVLAAPALPRVWDGVVSTYKKILAARALPKIWESVVSSYKKVLAAPALPKVWKGVVSSWKKILVAVCLLAVLLTGWAMRGALTLRCQSFAGAVPTRHFVAGSDGQPRPLGDSTVSVPEDETLRMTPQWNMRWLRKAVSGRVGVDWVWTVNGQVQEQSGWEPLSLFAGQDLVGDTGNRTFTVGHYRGDSEGTGYEWAFLVEAAPPVIALLGDDPQIIEVGTPYVEAGATVTDNYDQDLQAIIDTSDVNIAVLGDYEVTYIVRDSSGNRAAEVRLVRVVDTTPPVIRLFGEDQQTVEVGTPYAEAGATVTDNYDQDLQATIDSSAVDTTVLGEYDVTYIARDSAGNPAVQISRLVRVVDTTPPVITLLGDNPQAVEIRTPYREAGATVADNYDQDLPATIDSSAVNTTVIGDYAVTYHASDSSGNEAIKVVRIVNVVSRIAPVITLLGDNPQVIEVGTAYVEAGATVTDQYDKDLQATIDSSGVNTALVGEYKVTYNATDSSGNQAAEASRVVRVVDTKPPVIKLLGDDPQVFEVGAAYAEAGATVTDNYDKNLKATINSSAVNMAVLGEYEVTYNARDSSRNRAAQTTRRVRVVDTTPPVITLLGDNPQTVDVGAEYAEAGATVTDNYDKNLRATINSSAVNTTLAGEYKVLYNVSDLSDNQAAQVTRTVVVQQAPEVIRRPTQKEIEVAIGGYLVGESRKLTGGNVYRLNPQDPPSLERAGDIWKITFNRYQGYRDYPNEYVAPRLMSGELKRRPVGDWVLENVVEIDSQ